TNNFPRGIASRKECHPLHGLGRKIVQEFWIGLLLAGKISLHLLCSSRVIQCNQAEGIRGHRVGDALLLSLLPCRRRQVSFPYVSDKIEMFLTRDQKVEHRIKPN